METRAHHLAVGGFVLTLLAIFAVVVVWLGSIQLDEKTEPYLIYFKGSVTGLQVGSPVRYQGVPVGRVTDIRIDPNNVERVRATIEVQEGTPIKTDSITSLNLQGITGFVYIQISAGNRESPLLKSENGEIPVIRSRPSSIESVIDSTPELMENLVKLSEQAQALLSPENAGQIAATLQNARILSEELAKASKGLEGTLGQAKDTLANLNAFSTKAVTMIDTVQDDAEVIGDNVAKATEELNALTTSLRRSSDQISGMIEENREPIRSFTGTGLYEASLLISELRELAARLSRVTAEIERNPANFLLGRERGLEVR